MAGSACGLCSVVLVTGLVALAAGADGATGGMQAARAARAGPASDGTACEPGVHVLRVGNGRRALMRVGQGDESRRKALVLVLHGAGGTAQDGLYAFRGGWDARDVVLVAPSARGRTWSFLASGGDDLTTVDHALTQAFTRCPIDSRRVAVGGFSDGASSALSLGLRNGRLFRAVMALSPGGVHPGKHTGKPRIFIAHGTLDSVLPFSLTKDQLVPDLRAQGYRVTFRTFVGGHEAPASISRMAMGWFLG